MKASLMKNAIISGWKRKGIQFTVLLRNNSKFVTVRREFKIYDPAGSMTLNFGSRMSDKQLD